MGNLIANKSKRDERVEAVLLGLVELYIQEGKPVGSKRLQEAKFPVMGSATLRNYFAELEKRGLLKQEHTSGGRIPTDKAFHIYAKRQSEIKGSTIPEDPKLRELRMSENREVAAYLQEAAETLRSLTNLPIILSAPRFDQDFVTNLKLVPLDASRCLAVMVTNFGVIQTELVYSEQKISTHAAARIEAYFNWRLSGNDAPATLPPQEEAFAKNLYNELMVRHIVTYSNFVDDELHRTGFSELLPYPEFQDTSLLANCLHLFENAQTMRLLLKECAAKNQLKFWIGSDLPTAQDCALIAVPYTIGNKVVGACALLGPVRLPYRALFDLLHLFSVSISEALTRNIYKYEISFRTPEHACKEEHILLHQSRLMLLEDQRTLKGA